MLKKLNDIDFYNHEVVSSYRLNDTMRKQLSFLGTLDPFTRKHSENVASLTCRLCNELNLNYDFTIYTTMCAYLHDIGKIFIPPQVLQKPGRLTDEEYEVMKSHTTIGVKICMQTPELRNFVAGPKYHHEGLDGTGYPEGLLGEDIPYEGQIIRVADEFDAITSKRQYKTHIGVVDTLKILIENTKPTEKSRLPKGYFRKPGKNDRKVVKALLKVIAEDTEMEIFYKTEYLEYLQKELSRITIANNYYEKFLKEKRDAKKEYLKEYAKGYLINNENLEEIPNYFNEFKNAYDFRKEEINKLKKEVKEIRSLKV